MTPGPQHRILDQVFGNRNIASEAYGGPKQRTDMHQGELLELDFP
jgi:hypothetical protein